jgi:tRNA(Ile)-lysidine synthase
VESLIEKVRFTVEKRELLLSGDKVLVALSGGADSVALLHLLMELRDDYRLEPGVAHLHHMLRCPECDEDMEFAGELSENYGLRFFSKSVDVAAVAKSEGLTEEVCGRVERYRFFEEICKQEGFTKVALGHTADDRAETFLLNLLRGSATSGLASIPHKRDIFIRPLLDSYREEILNYLEEHRFRYRVDSSNYDVKIRRNKVRWELMPYLKEGYNPNLKKVLNRTAEVLEADLAALGQIVEGEIRKLGGHLQDSKIVLDLPSFGRYNLSLKRAIIRSCFSKLSPRSFPLSYRSVMRVLSLGGLRTGARVELPSGVVVERGKDKLIFSLPDRDSRIYRLDLPGECELEGLGIEIRGEVINLTDLPEDLKAAPPYTAFFDLERFSPPYGLRTRKPGDRFKPLGMEVDKKLSDFFIDGAVPRILRDEILLLLSGEKIAWVVGFRPHHDFRVREDSSKIMKVEVLGASYCL